MVNLVKTIEALSQNIQDIKLMKTLRKRLKGSKAEVNKLKQSTIYQHDMIAPIHAAAMSNSLELFKLVFETKGVDPDCVCSINKADKLGILDCAVAFSPCERRPNLQIIKFILDNVTNPILSSEKENGVGVSLCITASVMRAHLEVLDILHSKADKIRLLNPFLSLMCAIMFDKREVLEHVLSSANHLINHVEEKVGTLLDWAQLFDERDIFCKILVDAGGVTAKEMKKKTPAINGNLETSRKEEEISSEHPVENVKSKSKRQKICWNCRKSAETVPLYKCEGCRKARYCDDVCQEKDWSVHADYCQRKRNERQQQI